MCLLLLAVYGKVSNQDNFKVVKECMLLREKWIVHETHCHVKGHLLCQKWQRLVLRQCLVQESLVRKCGATRSESFRVDIKVVVQIVATKETVVFNVGVD